jgi:hypothetical protein
MASFLPLAGGDQLSQNNCGQNQLQESWLVTRTILDGAW